jgi:glycine cleavage system T protein (aminomethyltransferase)
MSEDFKKIPLNDVHVSLGGKMVDFAGYNMPVRYSSGIAEHIEVRKNVGVFDVSHMGELFVEGAQAAELVQYVTSNDVSKLSAGKIQYSCFPNESGGIVDDLLVYCFSNERFLLVVNASNIEKDLNWINSHNNFDCRVKNESDSYALFAVQGPKALDVIQKITETKLGDLSYYTFVEGVVGEVQDVLISATGYTGAGGLELYVKSDQAVALWNKIFRAGEEYGLIPVGLGARDTLRLEMGYCLYGNDIDEKTSPLEAGLGWITKFNAPFINSEDLLKQKEEGIKRKLVGFVMIDRGIPRKGYKIHDKEGREIGEVTSGSQSPILNNSIGMGYVLKDFSKAGERIFIEIRGKEIAAEIKRPPFVDPTL